MGSNNPICQLTDFRALKTQTHTHTQRLILISNFRIKKTVLFFFFFYLFPVQISPHNSSNLNTFRSWSLKILPEVCSTAMCTVTKPNQSAVYSASTKAILLHFVPPNVPQCFHHQVKESMPNGLYNLTAQEPYSNICSSHAWF